MSKDNIDHLKLDYDRPLSTSQSDTSLSEYDRIWPSNTRLKECNTNWLKRRFCLSGKNKPLHWDEKELQHFIKSYSETLHENLPSFIVPDIAEVWAERGTDVFEIACKNKKSKLSLLNVGMFYLGKTKTKNQFMKNENPWIFFEECKPIIHPKINMKSRWMDLEEYDIRRYYRSRLTKQNLEIHDEECDKADMETMEKIMNEFLMKSNNKNDYKKTNPTPMKEKEEKQIKEESQKIAEREHGAEKKWSTSVKHQNDQNKYNEENYKKGNNSINNNELEEKKKLFQKEESQLLKKQINPQLMKNICSYNNNRHANYEMHDSYNPFLNTRNTIMKKKYTLGDNYKYKGYGNYWFYDNPYHNSHHKNYSYGKIKTYKNMCYINENYAAKKKNAQNEHKQIYTKKNVYSNAVWKSSRLNNPCGDGISEANVNTKQNNIKNKTEGKDTKESQREENVSDNSEQKGKV